MADNLGAGASALQELIRHIGTISDDTCDSLGDGPGDGRDYVTMVKLVEASIGADLVDASGEHREGYLRALAHLLCLVADGAGPTGTWDPLLETSTAFRRPLTGTLRPALGFPTTS